jgi:cytidylate kinase
VGVIAIDGPAGSGKSTVARAVAARLRMDYLDTGAMYRSVALAVLRDGLDPDAGRAVGELARRTSIEAGERVLVDGQDATDDIRSPEVTGAVSAVAANPAVRAEMVRRQRQWAAEHDGGVIEGRDIGTVVFPDAAVKVFLTASDEERAQRRSRETAGMGLAQVAAAMDRRDHLDATRAVSPLAVADDAVVIDTTDRTVDSVVDDVVAMAEKAGL